MQVERDFIEMRGLPGRPYYRHVIQGPRTYDDYGAWTFPALRQTLHHNDWEKFDIYYKRLIERIEAATKTLRGT